MTKWIAAAAAAAATAAAVVVSLGVALAQTAPPPTAPPPMPRQATFMIDLKGQTINDTIKSVLIEHDRPQAWDLLITGMQGKAFATCELRSADKQLLFDLQRTIIESNNVMVHCANASLSGRGGALIDLDDPKGGSLVIGTNR
jgi:hypothetical protein